MTRGDKVSITIVAALAAISMIYGCTHARAQVKQPDFSSLVCSSKDDATCPVQCRQDLTKMYKMSGNIGTFTYKGESILVFIMQDDVVQAKSGINPSTGHTWGMWFGPPMLKENAIRSIYISSRTGGWLRDAIVHHEACHEVMYRETGSAYFHR